MRPIELLAPARDLACGMAAVDHGADSVYIGGPSFGARIAAGNSMEDIERLDRHSNRYRARVFLTLNTMLFDHELKDARRLAYEAWNAGVDALIIQDMGLLELELPGLPLIAITQMHNMDASHIRFLEQAGFKRVILARELSLDQIREIRKATGIELEAFVHGSLCVGLSGCCYLSAAIGARSANRGACGQPCRLPWTLTDSRGRTLDAGLHPLSLKDMDRSAFLEEMIASGVSAFKIEGRLKDEAYVKNVTAFYRKKLDTLFEKRPALVRASAGRTEILFTPDSAKTFHRGSNAYFLTDGQCDIRSQDTPKSIGEEIGTVASSGRGWITLANPKAELHAGDGLCWFGSGRALEGAQVAGTDRDRVLVRPLAKGINPGTTIYRNRDHRCLRALQGRTFMRRSGLSLVLREVGNGFVLEGLDEEGNRAEVELNIPREPADKPGAALQTIERQLSRLGESGYFLESLRLEITPCFIRASDLNRARRELTALMDDLRDRSYIRPVRGPAPEPGASYPKTALDYRYNISNRAARAFYVRHGVLTCEPAFEIEPPDAGAAVMTTRLCLRRHLGACPREKPVRSLSEPLFLEHSGRRFRLVFDCRSCLMQLLLEHPVRNRTG